MLKSFFNKVAGLRFVTLLKRAPTQAFSCEICKSFKNTCFRGTLPVAASDFSEICKFLKKCFLWSLPMKLPVTVPENSL